VSRKQRERTAAEKKQTPAIKRMHTWMWLKSIVTVVLLLFVAASVAYLVLSDSPVRVENPEENSEATDPVLVAPSPEPPDEVEEAQHRVIAYYFHGTSRCQTCRTIEQYAREAIEDGFSEELQSEMLEWHAVNVEEPQNNHFISDYELFTRSLVLVDMEDGHQTRWKNLERVWELVGDREAFISYVQEETRAYLGGH